MPLTRSFAAVLVAVLLSAPAHAGFWEDLQESVGLANQQAAEEAKGAKDDAAPEDGAAGATEDAPKDEPAQAPKAEPAEAPKAEPAEVPKAEPAPTPAPGRNGAKPGNGNGNPSSNGNGSGNGKPRKGRSAG